MKRKVASYVNYGSANPCSYIVSLHYEANSRNMETDHDRKWFVWYVCPKHESCIGMQPAVAWSPSAAYIRAYI